VTLTEVGKRVYDYADRIFELYTEMENVVREMTGEISGILTLGASTTIAEYMLPSLLGDFKMQYPEVNIRLKVSNTEGIVSMVEHNVIDLGVVEAMVTNKNLLVEECRQDELVVIVPPNHALAEETTIMPDRFLHYPFICREEGSGTREVVRNYFSEQGLDMNTMNVCLELGSPEAVKGAVEAGMGISITSMATIHKELQLGTLVAVRLSPTLTRTFAFVRQRHKFRMRAMDELLTFAQSYCRNLREQEVRLVEPA
jgi:DNA-binding transcriptional LysR family regulator